MQHVEEQQYGDDAKVLKLMTTEMRPVMVMVVIMRGYDGDVSHHHLIIIITFVVVSHH